MLVVVVVVHFVVAPEGVGQLQLAMDEVVAPARPRPPYLLRPEALQGLAREPPVTDRACFAVLLSNPIETRMETSRYCTGLGRLVLDVLEQACPRGRVLVDGGVG